MDSVLEKLAARDSRFLKLQRPVSVDIVTFYRPRDTSAKSTLYAKMICDFARVFVAAMAASIVSAASLSDLPQCAVSLS